MVSQDGDVTGNVFSIIPPTGTRFSILPGFEDPSSTSNLAISNTTITNALSQDSSTQADSNLGISVGVASGTLNSGSPGGGRVIVAIARDADSPSTNNYETYPKSGTGTNTAMITIMGIGLAIPPTSDISLNGTLSAIFDSIVPAGFGKSGGASNAAVSPGFPSLSGSFNICSFLNQTTSTSSSSSSSGSLSGSSSSSSSGLINSTSSSSSGSLNNCPPCLVSCSQCPTNCLENLINCDGVAYLNICDYQKIKCGCGISSSSTSSSGGGSSTSSTSSSSGAVVPNLNPNFSGVWKGIAKVTSSNGKSLSKLAVLKLCISDGELAGTVNVAGVINGGEILSQDIKSENEVDVDVADKNDDVNSINLQLVNNRRLSVGIEDTASFLARKTKVIKQCLQSFRKGT